MTGQSRRGGHREGEGHANDRPTEGDTSVTHQEMARRVREADRFAVQLPLVGKVPIPRPDQLAFYGALAALVAVELVEWPVAVAIGAGHALVTNNRDQPEKNRDKDSEPE